MRFLGLVILLAGCTGSILSPGASPTYPWDPAKPVDPTNPVDPLDPTQPPPPPDACEGVTIAAAPSVLRRLSIEQLKSSYRDVLKDAAAAPDLAPIAGPIITEQEVEKLNLAAKALVARNGHRAYVKCNIDGALNSTCADDFIADFGHQLFRRPLSQSERAAIKTDVYEKIRTNAAIVPAATFRELIDAVAETMLQSPEVIYVHEQGVADATLPAGIRRLSGNERAVRLSYLLWNSTPDAALLTAAESGGLDTADGVRAQAERLLADPRARKAVRGIVSSWLELDGNSHQASLELAPKDAARFPMDKPALRTAMREEMLALYERAFFDENGSFSALMTSPKAYVNRSLGQLYGVTAGLPANDATSAWVDLNTSERAGLFTRAGFLALYAPQDLQSPIRRGVFLFANALGRTLAPPPPNVDNTPLKPSLDALSVREQVEARTASAGCQACHSRINPLGFTLENYDALGRWQTTETGTIDGTPYSAPVNSTATVVGADIAGEVKGPIELATKLATSAQAHDTMAEVWFERANPRPAVANDACNLQRLTKRFQQTDDMRDLLVQLAGADSSLFLQETP